MTHSKKKKEEENHSTQAADYSGGCTTESKNICFNFGV